MMNTCEILSRLGSLCGTLSNVPFPGRAGHPEFSMDFMDTLIRWRTANAPEALPQHQADEALAQLRAQPVSPKDQAALQHLCHSFLAAHT